MDANDERLRAVGRRSLLAALLEGSGMRSRTNQYGIVRATLPEDCRPHWHSTSPHNSTGLHWIRDQTDNRDSVRLFRAFFTKDFGTKSVWAEAAEVGTGSRMVAVGRRRIHS